MANVYSDAAVMGGGFGGWGGGFGYGGGYGYGCGIPAFGLFGLCNNGFGNNSCCNDKCDHNGHFDTGIILDDNHYNSLQASIGGVKDTVITVKDNITALGYNIGDKFALTNSLINQVGYQGAINTKDIIHDIDIQSCNLGSKIDKCCCETNHNVDNKFFSLSKQLNDCCCELEKQGLKNTQVIIDKFTANEIQELRDKLRKCERDEDAFRVSSIIANSFRAGTAGSNFNTGVQASSTSNNSGQING